MLPDYPKLKREFRKRLDRLMKRKIAERAPVAGRIPVFLQAEGEEFRYQDNLGAVRSSRPQEVRAAFTIPKNLPPLATVQELFRALEGAAEDMARQTETIMFGK